MPESHSTGATETGWARVSVGLSAEQQQALRRCESLKVMLDFPNRVVGLNGIIVARFTDEEDAKLLIEDLPAALEALDAALAEAERWKSRAKGFQDHLDRILLNEEGESE